MRSHVTIRCSVWMASICLTLFSSLAAFGREATAEEIWVEGMTWKGVDFYLDGTLQINDHFLGSPIDVDGTPFLTVDDNRLWVHADKDCLYLFFPYPEELVVEGEIELMAYNFSNLSENMTLTGETRNIDYQNHCWAKEQLTYNFDTREIAPTYFEDAPEIWIYTSSDSSRRLASGIGWLDDFFSMIIYEGVSNSLIYRAVGEIRNPQGELIYRAPEMDEWEKQAGIGSAIETFNESSVLYDLFGRHVSNPRPGCIYIQNGRKMVFRR